MLAKVLTTFSGKSSNESVGGSFKRRLEKQQYNLDLKVTIVKKSRNSKESVVAETSDFNRGMVRSRSEQTLRSDSTVQRLNSKLKEIRRNSGGHASEPTVGSDQSIDFYDGSNLVERVILPDSPTDAYGDHGGGIITFTDAVSKAKPKPRIASLPASPATSQEAASNGSAKLKQLRGANFAKKRQINMGSKVPILPAIETGGKQFDELDYLGHQNDFAREIFVKISSPPLSVK